MLDVIIDVNHWKIMGSDITYYSNILSFLRPKRSLIGIIFLPETNRKITKSIVLLKYIKYLI